MTKLSQPIIINNVTEPYLRKSPECKHRNSAEAAVAIGALLIIVRKSNNKLLTRLVELAGEQLVCSENKKTQELIKSILIWSQTEVKTSPQRDRVNG